MICDADGEDLVSSRPFWRPAPDHAVPPTLAAVRLMAVAPQMLAALRMVLDSEYARDEASRNFNDETLMGFASLIALAEGRE